MTETTVTRRRINVDTVVITTVKPSEEQIVRQTELANIANAQREVDRLTAYIAERTQVLADMDAMTIDPIE